MKLEPLVNQHCACGENPLWDDARGLLYWCDIPAGKIWALDTASGAHREIYNGPECGAFALQADGSLLLLRTDEIARLEVESGKVTSLKSGVAPGQARFNDCIADPQGRVFSGTLGAQGPTGALFRLSPEGWATEICGGAGCSNGFGFTSDGRGLYWVETTSNSVYLFDYDEATGNLSNRRVWLETPGNMPDGMTVDRKGCLWIAFWDLAHLRRYSPQAELLETVEFPTKHVTAPIFGGANLDELYVTTAGGEAGSTTVDGTLYRLKPPVGGVPRHRARIWLEKS